MRTNKVLVNNQEERLFLNIKLNIDSVLISIKDAQRGERGYIISGNKSYLNTYYKAKNRFNQLFNKVSTLLKSQTEVRKNFISSKQMFDNAFVKLDEIIKTRSQEKNNDISELAKKDYEAKLIIDTLQKDLQFIEEYEKNKLLEDEHSAIKNLNEIVSYLILAGIINLSVVVSLSYNLVRYNIKREELSIQLNESEKRYNFLFELSSDPIFVTNGNGVITDCNQAAIKLFGYLKQEMLGKSFHLFFSEEGRLQTSQMLWSEIINNNNIYEREFISKDGRVIFSEVYAKKIEISGTLNIIVYIKDITEKKQALLSLKKSEEKYRYVFEKNLAAIFRTTIDGQIIECNDEFARALGYDSTSDVKNNSINSIYENLDDRNKLLEIVRKQGEVKNLILKFRKKDGSVVWVYDNVTLIYDDDLEKEILFGTFIDISAQKEAELKLAESESRYRDLVELLPQTIFELDLNERVTFVNRAGYEMFGYNSDDLKCGINFFQMFIPDDREKAIANFNTLLCGLKKQINNEYTALRKDGTTFPVLIYSSALIKNEILSGIRGIVIDISDLKKSEELLKQSEKRFRELIDKSPLAIAISKKGRLEYVNNKFIEMFGYNNFSELFQLPIVDLIAHPYKEIIKERNKYREQGINVISLYESLGLRKDGTTFPFQISAESIELTDGTATIAFITDITERKRAEEEIYRLNRIYTFLSSSNQAIVRIKNKEQLLNTACKIAIEYGKFKMSWIGIMNEEKGELNLVAYDGYVNGYLEEFILSSNKDSFGLELVKETIRSGKPIIINNIVKYETSIYWRRSALKRGFKSIAIFPLKAFGKVIGSFSLFSDQENFFEPKEIQLLEELSEDLSFALETIEIEKKRRESEILFYTLANFAPVGIFRTSADGYTTYVNPQWCKLSGLTLEEALGDGWLNAVHKEDRKWLELKWKNATRKKRQSASEYRFVHPNGRIVWVMGHAVPEINYDGQILGYIGTITDITNIKIYEEELIKAKEIAENSERMKSEFLAQMSHEIRTPINVIVSSSNYLKDELNGKIDQELFDMFYSLDRASKRIIRTIDLILRMAEVQTNNYRCTPIKIDLNSQILYSLYEEFLTLAKEKNLGLNLICNLPQAIVFVDEYSVRQIFYHIIDNAIKYTINGEIEIIIDRNELNNIEVNINDTGIGMTKEFLSKIFQPFTQEEQGYTRSFDGNGLGLALVKKYCELNDITIDVSSEKGKGSQFKLIFKSISLLDK